MTKHIRGGVFETNSSSSHSLVLARTDNILDVPFSPAIMERGVVDIQTGEYGWNVETFTHTMDKLSYLYTDAMGGSMDTDTPDPENNDKLKMIVDAVKEHTGCDVNFVVEDDFYPFGYIDHQSVGECDEVWDAGVEGVKRFVFNPDSYFMTDNDNY